MAPLPPLPKAVQPTTSTLLAPVVAASAAAVLGHIEKRVDFGKAAGDAMGAVQNAGETVVNKAPDALQNAGETVVNKGPDAVKNAAQTVAEKAPDALKKAGDAVADTAKTVAGKAVDLAKQVVDLGFKEMIEKWLKSFLKELLRKYWKWLLIPLAILLYYLGKLIFLWWKATRRQRTAHRLYREYVKPPPDYKFSTILDERRQKKVFSARMRRWLKRIRRAIWLRLRMLTTGQKKAALEQKDKVKRQLRADDCKEDFENDEEGRWNKFREELKKLEKTCVDEAIRADPTATDEKSREGIKGKVRRKTRGALRSYFRPGRLGGWIPDITCMGMWDRRRFFNSNIRGMKRLHFCNLMRQVIDVVAMANSRRDTRKVWDLEARLRIKEEADRLKVEKKAIEMANNFKPSEKVNNRLSGDTFVEKGEKNKRWPGRSAATAGGKK